MKTRWIVLALATAATLATPAIGQSDAEEDRWQAAQRRYEAEHDVYERERDLYEAAIRRDQDYDAAHAYRYQSRYEEPRYEEPSYEDRPMTAEDEVYRGSDGRYYCKRSNGTTGLVVGAGAGALLGRAIDGGHSRGTGTIIGGVVGALLGREAQRGADVRCR